MPENNSRNDRWLKTTWNSKQKIYNLLTFSPRRPISPGGPLNPSSPYKTQINYKSTLAYEIYAGSQNILASKYLLKKEKNNIYPVTKHPNISSYSRFTLE